MKTQPLKSIRNIRKTGIQLIAGVVLAALLGLNVTGQMAYAGTLCIVAFAVLAAWLVAMAVVGRFRNGR